MAPSLKIVAVLLLPAVLIADSPPSDDVAELRREVAALKAELDDALGRRLATLSEVAADAATAKEKVTSLGVAMDSAWLILCGSLVMFMHAGFAMLETGSCRAKNAQNVLMKNLVNVCVGTIAWWIFGWAFAYGGPYDSDGMLENKFIGSKQFAGDDFLEVDGDGNQAAFPAGEPAAATALSWFFQWAFCTAAATIVSGGVAERVKSPTYAAYAFVMAGFIYPLVVAWTWGYGWLADLFDVGFMDFAGSGIVHLTGGVSALAGAIVLGPRKGRFDRPEDFAPHSLPLVVLGTLALWFGWYGFNCGSTLAMSDASTGALAAQVAMNTTLSAACGGIVTFVLRYVVTKPHLYDVGALCNGILAGLVSITAGCGNVEAGSAVCIGTIGAFIYQGASMLLQKLRIDDPVDASAVHGACGIWGVLAAALFDWGKGFDHYHGWSGFSCMTNSDGSCQSGIGGKALGANIVLILAVLAWTGVLSGVTFFALMKFGQLRIDEDTEEKGMDAAKHSPSKAYTLDSAI